MQTFEKWLSTNHPELQEENWRKTVGALALSGASFFPSMTNAAPTGGEEIRQTTIDRELDQRLQGKYPKKNGGRTDELGQADWSRFGIKEFFIVMRDKNNTSSIARQAAQIRLSEFGIIVDGHGYITLTDKYNTIKIKAEFLKMEKGYIHIRGDDGTTQKLPYNWLSPESQQLVSKITE